jgi:adenylate kinase
LFQPRIKAFVVSTGILYGNGERILYNHFRKAWTGGSVPLLGDGTNIIPTVHVSDVAKLIRRIIYREKKSKVPQYLLAVDHGRNT